MISQIANTTVFSSEHPNIISRISISKLLFSLSFILIGILMLVFASEITSNSSPYVYGLFIGGVAFLIVGIYRLLCKSKETIYTPTGSLTKERSLFFDLKHRDELKQYVASGNFPSELNIKTEDAGNIRMDVIISQDNKFIAVQLLQFVPYAYNPITSIYYYTNNETGNIVSFLLKNGVK